MRTNPDLSYGTSDLSYGTSKLADHLQDVGCVLLSCSFCVVPLLLFFLVWR